jgi:hypothetical protein
VHRRGRLLALVPQRDSANAPAQQQAAIEAPQARRRLGVRLTRRLVDLKTGKPSATGTTWRSTSSRPGTTPRTTRDRRHRGFIPAAFERWGVDLLRRLPGTASGRDTRPEPPPITKVDLTSGRAR